MFDIEFNPKENFLKQELAVSGINNNILGAIAGAALNFGLGAIGQSSANSAAKKQTELANKVAKQDWEYQNRGIEARNEYAKEGVQIQRENRDYNIALQEQQAADKWSYDMTIRDFQYDGQMKAYGMQKANLALQLNFNESAFAAAEQKQDNWLAEQKLNFDFAELENDLQWKNGATSYQLRQSGLDIQQQSKRASNNFATEKAQIDSLKGEGLARAKGQAGRTAGKRIQAAIAEAGLVEAEIAEDTFNAGRQYANSSSQNAQQLQELSDAFGMAKQQIAAGRISASNADKFMRKDLKMQKFQADQNALAKVMLKPELAPDLPVPPDLDLYKGTIQDAFEVELLPEPIEGVAATSNPWVAGLSAAAPSLVGIAGSLGKSSAPAPPIDYYGGGSSQFNRGSNSSGGFGMGIGLNFDY